MSTKCAFCGDPPSLHTEKGCEARKNYELLDRCLINEPCSCTQFLETHDQVLEMMEKRMGEKAGTSSDPLDQVIALDFCKYWNLTNKKLTIRSILGFPRRAHSSHHYTQLPIEVQRKVEKALEAHKQMIETVTEDPARCEHFLIHGTIMVPETELEKHDERHEGCEHSNKLHTRIADRKKNIFTSDCGMKCLECGTIISCY